MVNKQFFFPTEYNHLLALMDEQFFLQPSRSSYKMLFFGTRLGKILQTMSFAKSVPEGLKLSECDHGVGGKKISHSLHS
jgi:hypothetical protein